jgi:cyclophilin family peptidyl-prolyl cis-trans isomerase
LFGKVVKGLDVVTAMEAVDTDRSDRPKAEVVIQSVTISESD